MNVSKNAIILAAGIGTRMVPVNLKRPKGLMKVNGESLIERMISQLHDRNITEIYMVVGFLKEQYRFLEEKYGVKLIENPYYYLKENIYSLKLAKEYLKNTYIIPCDIYSEINIFSIEQEKSWYMITNTKANNSNVKIGSDDVLIRCEDKNECMRMIGISYLDEEISEKLKMNLDTLCLDPENDSMFWEEALFENDVMYTKANIVDEKKVFEIDTFEQLRNIDESSDHLKNDAIDIICSSLHVSSKDIYDITVLKKGMTNRSFLFSVKDKRYIMRIPGEGTEQLINRKEEASVYRCITDKDLCDNIIYINEENGYKITEYMEGAKVCDPYNKNDLDKCMKRLREFHALKLQVNHVFSIFDKILYYEDLWNGYKSIYEDYEKTKENVFKLKKYIDAMPFEMCLTHIDAVPDNFLIWNKEGKEDIRLIDWEYASMQDPHVDIAMFCIYTMYDRSSIDQLIDIYFEGCCDIHTRIKIYAYIAMCGLLWSNWCEYKAILGVEFGEYSIKQYEYAKEYFEIVKEELYKMGENYGL